MSDDDFLLSLFSQSDKRFNSCDITDRNHLSKGEIDIFNGFCDNFLMRFGCLSFFREIVGCSWIKKWRKKSILTKSVLSLHCRKQKTTIKTKNKKIRL